MGIGQFQARVAAFHTEAVAVHLLGGDFAVFGDQADVVCLQAFNRQGGIGGVQFQTGKTFFGNKQFDFYIKLSLELFIFMCAVHDASVFFDNVVKTGIFRYF